MQNGAKLSKTVHNVLQWCKLYLNGPRNFKFAKMVQNSQNFFEMFQDGPIWSNIFKIGHK